MLDLTYTICQQCDHFVEEEDDGIYVHLDDGEKEHDHDAIPGEKKILRQWKIDRPKLFHTHKDKKIGPNSFYHILGLHN